MEGRRLWNEWVSEWKDGYCGMSGTVSGRTEIVE